MEEAQILFKRKVHFTCKARLDILFSVLGLISIQNEMMPLKQLCWDVPSKSLKEAVWKPELVVVSSQLWEREVKNNINKDFKLILLLQFVCLRALYSPGWPWIYYPASTSCVLGLQAHTTSPSLLLHFINIYW